MGPKVAVIELCLGSVKIHLSKHGYSLTLQQVNILSVGLRPFFQKSFRKKEKKIPKNQSQNISRRHVYTVSVAIFSPLKNTEYKFCGSYFYQCLFFRLFSFVLYLYTKTMGRKRQKTAINLRSGSV